MYRQHPELILNHPMFRKSNMNGLYLRAKALERTNVEREMIAKNGPPPPEPLAHGDDADADDDGGEDGGEGGQDDDGHDDDRHDISGDKEDDSDHEADDESQEEDSDADGDTDGELDSEHDDYERDSDDVYHLPGDLPACTHEAGDWPFDRLTRGDDDDAETTSDDDGASADELSERRSEIVFSASSDHDGPTATTANRGQQTDSTCEEATQLVDGTIDAPSQGHWAAYAEMVERFNSF